MTDSDWEEYYAQRERSQRGLGPLPSPGVRHRQAMMQFADALAAPDPAIPAPITGIESLISRGGAAPCFAPGLQGRTLRKE